MLQIRTCRLEHHSRSFLRRALVRLRLAKCSQSAQRSSSIPCRPRPKCLQGDSSSTLNGLGCLDRTQMHGHVAASSIVEAAASVPEVQDSVTEEPILQYVVVRRDLYTDLKWPLGSVIAQACHAATAALWESREADLTQQYCSPQAINDMHKVVLEVKGETQLYNLATRLQEAGVKHKLWIEQPENFPTCIAAAPCRKSEVQKFFKRLKLCSF